MRDLLTSKKTIPDEIVKVAEKPRPISEEIYQRLCEVIPGGVNSPVRACTGLEMAPLVADYGRGDLIVDCDGHAYVDYCGSWGALIHGHAHPDILHSVQKRMMKGTTFGMTTPVEEAIARKVTELVPSIEKIRFVSSGTEATMSAVRLARGATKRDLIIKFIGHYHGHADFFLVQAGSGVAELSSTSSSLGIPHELIQHTICLPFNDIAAVKKVLTDTRYNNNIAAVILEPIAGNMGVVPASADFIQMLREETEKIGTLLIFDEVITGFRVGLGGAQALYQVRPDLTCLGKIIGGGFPAAAFGGRKDLMDYLAPLGPVYQAGTLSGNPVAMEAGLQALKMLERPGFYDELQDKTDRITQPVKQFISDRNLNACLQQVGSMFTLFFGRKHVDNMADALAGNKKQYAHFFKHLFERGFYIPPFQYEAWFVSSAHTVPHLEKTRDAVLAFLSNLC
jgi:glutamate-1-semialdehyde 2,1-aminomutase